LKHAFAAAASSVFVSDTRAFYQKKALLCFHYVSTYQVPAAVAGGDGDKGDQTSKSPHLQCQFGALIGAAAVPVQDARMNASFQSPAGALRLRAMVRADVMLLQHIGLSPCASLGGRAASALLKICTESRLWQM
jgi:hypothetical protein